MPYKLRLSCGLMLCLAVANLTCWAQQSSSGSQQSGDSSGAKPAASGSLLIPDQDIVADDLPLSGVQNLTLGAPASVHTFLLPSFGIAAVFQTNPYLPNQPNSQTTVESGYVTGRLDLSRTSGRSKLSLNYLGGGSFSDDSTQGTSGIQSLHFSDTIGWGRWTATVGDQLNYT